MSRAWTGSDENRLRQLVSMGRTDEEIRIALDRTLRSVAVKRQRLGLVQRTINSRAGGNVREYASYTLRLELRRRGYRVSNGPVRRAPDDDVDLPISQQGGLL